MCCLVQWWSWNILASWLKKGIASFFLRCGCGVVWCGCDENGGSFVLVCPSLNNWKKQRKYAQHLSLCYDPIQDLLRTISIVTEHVLLFNLEAGGKRSECLYQEASTIAQRVRKAFILRDLDQVLLAIQAYNELIRSYRKLKLGPVVVEEEEEKAEFFNPPALVEHLIHQVYSRMASPFAELLREYRGIFSSFFNSYHTCSIL